MSKLHLGNWEIKTDSSTDEFALVSSSGTELVNISDSKILLSETPRIQTGEVEFGSSEIVKQISTGWYTGTSSATGWNRFVKFPHNGSNNKNIGGHLLAHNRKDSTGNFSFRINTWIEAGEFDGSWGSSGDILDSGTHWRVIVGSDTTNAYLELDLSAGWDTGWFELKMDTHDVNPQNIFTGF